MQTEPILRELAEPAEMQALSDLFAQIWKSSDEDTTPTETLVAALASGHQIHGAFDGSRLIGGSWGFLTYDGEHLGLHSHITGVLPAYEGTGLGLRLKQTQRAWCEERSIATITWTFDPMIARNAAFNLRKLGARGIAFLPNFYGAMHDQFNEGEPTDRIEIAWDVAPAPTAAIPEEPVVSVAVPADYLALRAADPSAAHAERLRVGADLAAAFASGAIATGFDRKRGYLFTPARGT